MYTGISIIVKQKLFYQKTNISLKFKSRCTRRSRGNYKIFRSSDCFFFNSFIIILLTKNYRKV